jgi:HTH-type transcriptional regulator/antitoxin HigA
MSVVTVSPEYSALLTRFPPKVIRTEKENESYTKILYDLDRRSKTLTRAEKELAELLTLLIEDFEERQYQLPQTTPLDVLNFLMDQHGLRQKDLVDVFGTPSIVSEVLSGKRELNKEHIKRLSERFTFLLNYSSSGVATCPSQNLVPIETLDAPVPGRCSRNHRHPTGRRTSPPISALYQERQVRPRWATDATRLTMVWLGRLFDWKEALIAVRPETYTRWHRQGFKLLWRWKSQRIGRPGIPKDLRQLILAMARDNPTWGQARLAGELRLKLGIQVCPVRKFDPSFWLEVTSRSDHTSSN